jgi:precorrin-6Y C5,15-methyltransferase (decarboxylating)
MFTNEVILSWLQYFSQYVDINLAKLKMLDITGKNKNLIPAIMCNRAVLVFTDAGHPDIFYDMWNAELETALSGTTRARSRAARLSTTRSQT